MRKRRVGTLIDRAAVSRLVGLLPRLYRTHEIQGARNQLTKNGRWKETDLQRLLDERKSIRNKDQQLFLALVKELGGMKSLANRLHRLEERRRVDHNKVIQYATDHPGTSALYILRPRPS